MSARRRLGELLVEAGAIDAAQLASALAEHQQWGRPLGATLLSMHLLDEETLVRTLARQLKIPVVWLRGKVVRPEIVELVPAEVADKHRCMPVLLDQRGGKTLILAMENPADVAAIDQVAFHTGLAIRPVLAAPAELEEALERHYPGSAVATGDLSLNNAIFSDGEPPDGPELLSLSLPEAPASGALASGSSAIAPDSGPAVGNDGILRALTQLLVEKGILSREELIERLRALEADDSGKA